MRQIESGSFTSTESIESPTALHIVSWNIARGSQLDLIIEFLASVQADIIFLQEADRNARRTGYRNISKEIAQRLRVHYAFGREFEELGQGSSTSPAYHGQATLSRWPLTNCSILRFQTQSSFWRPHWFIPSLGPLQRRRGGRMALFSNVQIPGASLATYNLHCESRGGDNLRLSQLNEFLQDAKRHSLEVPVLAAGDFNFDLSRGQGAPAIAELGFSSPFTALDRPTTISPSHSARSRAIDWILLRGPLIGSNPQVHTSVIGSDHYPLSLTVSFL